MEKIVREIYERFDKRRKAFEAKAEDLKDIEELEELEGELKHRQKPLEREDRDG
jgi:hypothetical protein